LPSHFFSTTSFMDSWISSCNIDLDPALCSGGRRPRSTVDGGRRQRSAKGRDRRRPKAGVGACRASRARTRAEAPIQVRKGPFDPPLCVSSLVCPSDAMLLPSSAIRHAMALLRPAQVPCRLNDSTMQPIPFPHFGPVFLGTGAAAISGRLSAPLPPRKPETPIPPLSLPLPRLPSHAHSNTFFSRPL